MKQDLQKGAAICISVAGINNKNNRKCDSQRKLYSNGIGNGRMDTDIESQCSSRINFCETNKWQFFSHNWLPKYES